MSLLLLLFALAIGCCAAAAVSKVTTRPLLAGAGAGFTATIIATIVSVVLVPLNFFVVIHLWYLIGVVSIPLSAALTLALSIRFPHLRTKSIRIVSACGLLLAAVGFYGTYIEPFRLRTDQVTLASDTFDEEITIGVLSDLQTTGIGEYETEALQKLVDENPDIVLIPGDFWQLSGADNRADKVKEFQAAMQFLSDNIDHVIAVNGNTDTVADLRLLTEDTGVVVLDNETHSIQLGEKTLVIGGISLFADDTKRAEAITQLQGLNSDEVFTILLSHKPDEIFLLDPKEPVDLVVAGHTHGGQISLPFLGPPVTLSNVPRHIGAGGLHQYGNQSIYVSTGVGRERGHAPQMRLGVRPSIGIISVTNR